MLRTWRGRCYVSRVPSSASLLPPARIAASVLILALLAPVISEASGRWHDEAVSGVVTDRSGAVVPDAEVALLTVGNTEVARGRTDAAGAFVLTGVPAGQYVLLVQKPGFASQRRTAVAGPDWSTPVRIQLEVSVAAETVTVTAVRGQLQETTAVPDFVTVTSFERLWRRGFTIFPQALREEPGVSVQQTSTSQASPYIRGLTGQHVVNLIDGVRFNNAAFRPGANQYTAVIDPFAISHVEVVRGPHSTQYGSDALGGTVNVVTRSPQIFSGQSRPRVSAALFGGTADRSAGGAGHAGLGRHRWGLTVGSSYRRAGDLRTGGGVDSRSVATRLLGLPSSVLGTRLDLSGFDQYGANGRFDFYPTTEDRLSITYLHGAQTGAQRYDQLNGGLGNLLHRFDPQTMHFAVARYERLGVGVLDSVSVTTSFNRQRDDRETQSINNARGLLSPISVESNRSAVLGYQVQAATSVLQGHRVVFGADVYDDRTSSSRMSRAFDAASGGFTGGTNERGRLPDGATYRTLGLFVQDSIDLPGDRASAIVGVRYSRFGYTAPADEGGAGASSAAPFSTTFGDLTYRVGGVYRLREGLSLVGSVSRGFRAPNVNDFGTIGVSGAGFEVSPDEGTRLGASAARTGTLDAQAPVRPLVAEQLVDVEGGVKLYTARAGGTLTGFHSVISDSIERRTLLLPAGATGSTIGGVSIVRQDPSGAIYTPLASNPVFVRANAGRVRLAGVEGAAWVRMSRDVTLDVNFSYVRGTNLDTGRPPDNENGIPPAFGFAGVNWQPDGRRFWAGGYAHFAFAQSRLSQNDLQQPRIGGIRTAQEITAFFNNGAAARGLVRDGVLLATGERVEDVIRRVIGPDTSARVPLFTTHSGFVSFNLRGGVRLSSNTGLVVILENLTDVNYRIMGSGVDAPGINLIVRYSLGF